MTTTANAVLIDSGGGMIYDTDRNITWLQDGSYIRTTGYDDDGKVGRGIAKAWVESLDYGGFNDWRLPGTLNVDPSCSTDALDKLYLTLTPCSGGEMGHLFYSEGLEFKPNTATIPKLGTLGPFDNVYGGGYWTSEDYVWTGQPYEDPAGTEPTTEKPYPRIPRTGFAWLFYFGGDPGAHKTLLKTGNPRGVWPVRDGFDVHLEANRWTMIGLPFTPVGPATVESVFGDDLNIAEYDTRWVMYEWDAVANSYSRLFDTNSTLSQSKGYWIYSLDAANLDVEGTDTQAVVSPECAVDQGCYEIVLTPPTNGIEQYNMIGHALPSAIPWKDVRIRTVAGDGTTNKYTPSEAALPDNNIMDKTIWLYNGGGYDQYDDNFPTEGQVIAFDAFWVRTLPGASGVTTTLLLPKGPAP
jgi:hypothetical protein